MTTTDQALQADTRHISKRDAYGLFLAAKYNVQEMWPRAEAWFDAHGSYPQDYLDARADMSRKFGWYVDAGIFGGISIPMEG